MVLYPSIHKAELVPHDPRRPEGRCRNEKSYHENQIHTVCSPKSAVAYRLFKMGDRQKRYVLDVDDIRSRLMRGHAKDWSKIRLGLQLQASTRG